MSKIIFLSLSFDFSVPKKAWFSYKNTVTIGAPLPGKTQIQFIFTDQIYLKYLHTMIFSPPQIMILGVALNQLPVNFYCIDSPGKPPGPPAVSEGKYGFSWPSPLLLKRPDLLARASGNLPSPRVLSNRGF